MIAATDGSGVQTYHLYDGLGSTTDLTDGSGNVTAGYGYDVFGGASPFVPFFPPPSAECPWLP